MQPEMPSRTAYRVALRRAAHQVFDTPVVFRDPFALRILGLTADRLGPTDLRAPNRPSSQSLRAFLVARSLFAEESLAASGARQYVLLGAGLDTFALRNQTPDLRVFEVDHPATQRWKQRMLRETHLVLPSSAVQVAVDFEHDNLEQKLREAGVDAAEPALFAMLGVVPYLTAEAFAATLSMLGRRSGATSFVLDHGLPRHLLPPEEQLAFDSLSQRVAQAGEPFRLAFAEEELADLMGKEGFAMTESLTPAEINLRYFAERESPLRVRGTGARLVRAVH